MRLLGALTLRLVLLFWFVAGSSFALKTHHGRGLTAVHRAVHVVARDIVVGEIPRVVANREGQGKVDIGSAPDGAGTGYDLSALLRLTFELAVGLYLTSAGMRWWRITTGLAIGLVFAFCGQSSSQRPSCSNHRDRDSVCSLGDHYQRHKRKGCNRYHSDIYHIVIFRAWVPLWSLQVLSSGRADSFEYSRWDVSWDASCSAARGTPPETNGSELDHRRPVHGYWVRSGFFQTKNRRCGCHRSRCISQMATDNDIYRPFLARSLERSSSLLGLISQ